MFRQREIIHTRAVASLPHVTRTSIVGWMSSE